MHLFIGNRNYSSWSLRAWLVLRHFGIRFEERLMLLNGEGWKRKLRQVSPTGRVPVLVDGDLVIPETLAIIEYLAERCPAHAIWPGNGHSRALARAAASEMHAGFQALRTLSPMKLRASFPATSELAPLSEYLPRTYQLWYGLLDRSWGSCFVG